MNQNVSSLFRIALLMALSLAFSVALAQSGRRAAKPSKTPPPDTTVEEPKAEKPAPKSDIGKFAILITSRAERAVSTSSARTILYSFSERLKEEKQLAVKDGSASSPSNAKSIAVAGNDGYVIWLDLMPDTYDSNSRYGGATNYDDIVIQYYVYTPVTGKIRVQGHMYYQAPRRRTSGGGLPGIGSQPLPPSRFPVEYTPERAGRETASRILDSLKEVMPR